VIKEGVAIERNRLVFAGVGVILPIIRSSRLFQLTVFANFNSCIHPTSNVSLAVFVHTRSLWEVLFRTMMARFFSEHSVHARHHVLQMPPVLLDIVGLWVVFTLRVRVQHCQFYLTPLQLALEYRFAFFQPAAYMHQRIVSSTKWCSLPGCR